MGSVRIIVPVLEEHDVTEYGQYVREVTLPRVPAAGEFLVVATKATAVQNVIWHVGEAMFESVEVYLSPRPLGPSFPETINELFDNGFVPMNPDGTERTWEEDAQLREAVANGVDPYAEVTEEEVAQADVEVEEEEDEPLDLEALGTVIEHVAEVAKAPDFHTDEQPSS